MDSRLQKIVICMVEFNGDDGSIKCDEGMERAELELIERWLIVLCNDI
jgi:hypothetical protein